MRHANARFLDFMRLEKKRANDALTPDELRRWMDLKRSLAREFSPGISDRDADRRQSLRVPTRLRVSFETRDALVDSMLTNLSRAGLFVQCEHPLPIGERVVLSIHIQDPAQSISVEAEVVSQNVGPGFPRTELGMGMRFRGSSPEVEKQLEELYESSLRRAIRSRW